MQARQGVRGAAAAKIGAKATPGTRFRTGTAVAPAAKGGGHGPDPSCQPCPACGGLECLCRPRFFAGQLLTEQDLNRLDHYITAKHRLHNRHLFGAGVVCGLEVRCAPCDEGMVSVSTGYALSPCGEDIVVCKPDMVDVCALVSACREVDAQDCRPYQGRDACDEVEEQWILAIRYAESPARPTAPVPAGGIGACGCGSGGCKGAACGCGGGCGCGGRGASTGLAATGLASTGVGGAELPRLRRGAPPACEPSVTCEGYRYDVFRLPEPERRPRDPRGKGDAAGGAAGVILGSLAGFFETLEGEMAARIACCLRELDATLPRPPANFSFATAAERQAWFRWCCGARQGLGTWFARNGGGDCEVTEKLGAIPCPDPSLDPQAFQSGLEQSATALVLLALEAVQACICGNALPPCPAPADPRVPLALVTIRRRDCHIVSVCNWTPLRRHVVTMPTLGYWFGWLPLGRILRELMEQVCCSALAGAMEPPTREPARDVFEPNAAFATATAAPMAQPMMARGGVAMGAGFSLSPLLDARLGQAVLRQAAAAPEIRSADLFDLVFRRPAYAAPEGLDAKDEAALADRLADSGLARVLGGLLGDAGRQLLPQAQAATLRQATTKARAQPEAPSELAEMKAMMARQEGEIAALRADLAALRRGG